MVRVIDEVSVETDYRYVVMHYFCRSGMGGTFETPHHLKTRAEGVDKELEALIARHKTNFDGEFYFNPKLQENLRPLGFAARNAE